MLKSVLLSFVVFAALGVVSAQAQRGCCSHHGGVCGCSCCDGSPLSQVCSCSPLPNPTPVAPSELSAGSPSENSLLLTWVDESNDETGFRIESHKATQVTFTTVATVGPNSESYRVSHLDPGTTYVFRVAATGVSGDSLYSNETTASTLAATCVAGPLTLCLGGGRFRVEATYTAAQQAGQAHLVSLTPDTGYLWFFDAANVEAVVKVIDGCALGGHYWVFAGGLTNVLTVITVTDLHSGAMKTYTNPQGKAFQPIQDTSAFASCQ